MWVGRRVWGGGRSEVGVGFENVYGGYGVWGW